MSQEIKNYLGKMPHFSFLPEEEIDRIAQIADTREYHKGRRLAVQGETSIKDIFVVRRGQLSLYEEKDGRQQFGGHIKPGEVFGGITILMNGGISLRTVYVDENSEFYLIPDEKFLDLCKSYKKFYEYFLENFSSHIADKSLEAIIKSGQARRFLSEVPPFSFLPEAALERASNALSVIFYPRGTFLFVQSRTPVGYLYILQKGSAERYIEEGGGKTMRAILDEGDIYGGISILLNDGVSLKTLEVTEDSYFYLLPKKEFQHLCSRYEAFVEYFTDTFGKRMLDKTYASLVARTSASEGEKIRFFNQSVRQIYHPNPIFGSPDMTIREAARKMRQEKSSFLIFDKSKGIESGIVTTTDLSNKVIAEGLDFNRPAIEIISRPLFAVKEQTMIFEALMKMMEHDIKHLAVTDSGGTISGVITNRELLSAQGQSPLFLLREISQAGSFDDIADKHQHLAGLVKHLINSGATARNINQLTNTVSQSIRKKILGFALEEMGSPPCDFAFMIMGSEGREEQTLKTDQDNAIIFADVTDSDLEPVSKYFLELGERICTMLDKAGYTYCPGDIMAKNPKWCQPLGVWKKYFSKWIYTAEGEDLLQASIFFDFRSGDGNSYLVEDLRRHLFDALGEWSGFFRHMTENALHFKPPLGFFRNFVVESKGKHRNSFDIKGAMMPIVDFARIYALKNRVEATNTFDRLHELYIKKVLSKDDFEELEKAYGFLMQLRFSRQVTVVTEGESPDNYINPKKLTHVEQTMLKEIFKRIEKFQTRLEFDFIGIA